jgi:hypothetical protein
MKTIENDATAQPPDRNRLLTRRRFLQTSGALGLGSMLLPRDAWAAEPAPKVARRKFGRTGVEVPMLALGGIFDTRTNQAVLRQAVNLGVTYWDTAEGYLQGGSETGMGTFFERNPELRKEVFLVSKAGGRRSVREMGWALDESLARLKTDHVDLYLMHGVKSIDRVDTPEVKAWVEQAKQSGKIRLFGFSTHTNMEDCLAGAAKLGWIDGIMMTYNYRLMRTAAMKAAVEACAEAGVGLTAMKTIGRGSGGETAEQTAILGPFKERGFSAEQAMLKAVWENPDIATICSQMPNLNLLRQNVAAAMDQTALTQSDRETLARHAAATCDGYCAGCARLCESALGGDVPVRDVLRQLMYHRHYGAEIDARALFAEIPAEARARLARIDYAAAERVCPQHVPIARLVGEAVRALA